MMTNKTWWVVVGRWCGATGGVAGWGVNDATVVAACVAAAAATQSCTRNTSWLIHNTFNNDLHQ